MRLAESKNEVGEIEAESNTELLSTVDKFCLSPLNNRSFDIAYPSKNHDQVKSRATKRALVVSAVGCSCRILSTSSHQPSTGEDSQRVPVNKSRSRKNEKPKGKVMIVDHGNNNSFGSNSLANSHLASAAVNSPVDFDPKKSISDGDEASSSAVGFEPGTCSAVQNNKKYNIDSAVGFEPGTCSAVHNIDSAACSSSDEKNENENDLIVCNLLSRECEECACSVDVEGNLVRLQGCSCSVHGKAGQSFAVVKRSEDPYSDFKSSMVQMILEKNIYQPTELRGLLECFLSLNSPEHHWIIMEAFTEICVNISCVLSEEI